jgi:hypothetical protein
MGKRKFDNNKLIMNSNQANIYLNIDNYNAKMYLSMYQRTNIVAFLLTAPFETKINLAAPFPGKIDNLEH